jgi:hypothetical protein
MANLGSLVANVVANTAPFERGMKRAGKSLQELGTKSTAGGSSIRAMGMKFAKAAGTVALLGAVMRRLNVSLRELTQLGNEARGLDMTVQALRAFQYAGQQAGMQAGEVTTALARMGQSITQAAHGTGEAVEPLKQLGLEARQLGTLAPEQQFQALAAAFGTITSPAEKARLATALFGSAGRDMLAVLGQGADGIEKQSEEFEKLSGKITELDMEKLARLDSEVKKIGVVWKATWNQALIAAEPILTLLAKIVKMSGFALSMLLKYNPLFVVFNLHRDRQNRLMKKTAERSRELQTNLEAERKKQEALKRAEAEKLKAAEKAREEIQRQGEAVRREFLNPQEKLQERVADLNRLVEAGAITWKTYQRAVAGAVKDMKDANKQTSKLSKRQAVGAVTRGSTAAFSAVQAAKRDAEHQRRVQAEQLAEQRETNRILDSIDVKTEPTTVSAVKI